MENQDQSTPLDEFPPQVRQDVEGLLFLGALSDEANFCGHSWGLRTLKAGEELAASKAIEPYMQTAKAADAWSAAQVGLALTHVDGEDDFCPPAGPNSIAFAKARFQYVTDNWYQPTIDYLFGVYARLLDRQLEAYRALQDLSARSLHTSSPSADFLNEQGIFVEPMRLGNRTSQS